MKTQRFIAAFDFHGDNHDPDSYAAFKKFTAYFKPDIRINGGDTFDFRPFRSKAGDQERRESVREDMKWGIDFLSWFRPHVTLWGNHDKRIFDATRSDDGKVSDLARECVSKIESVVDGKTYEYDKRTGWHQVGDLKVLHGYAHGKSVGQVTVAAYGKSLMGHVHSLSITPAANLAGDVCYTSGGLCKIDLPYNAATVATLRQANGFAYGFVRHGVTQVFLASKMGDEWIMPTEFKSL